MKFIYLTVFFFWPSLTKNKQAQINIFVNVEFVLSLKRRTKIKTKLKSFSSEKHQEIPVFE